MASTAVAVTVIILIQRWFMNPSPTPPQQVIQKNKDKALIKLNFLHHATFSKILRIDFLGRVV